MQSIEQQILIVELGGQLTQNIGRVLRSALKVRPIILPPDKAETWLAKHSVVGIILSGSGHSVNDADAPKPPEAVFKPRPDGTVVPILGICYGMQYLAKCFGGVVEKVEKHREYGPAIIKVEKPTVLFRGLPFQQTVWSSHGDSVINAGPEFEVIATTGSGGIAAMVNHDQTIYAVQFHPEATQSEYGELILANFVLGRCGCSQNWDPGSVVDYIRGELAAAVDGKKVVLPYSGGVDSSVAAAIASPVLRERLAGFTLDGDQLRLNEGAEIRRHAWEAGLNWKMIDARQEFVAAVSQTIDGAQKRANFQRIYADYIRRLSLEFDPDPNNMLIIQGTLAPDMIESGETGGHRIVGHHNTGIEKLLPEYQFLHPLQELFKHEVREIAQSLQFSPSVYLRQPFPGPGLFLRVVGLPATHEMLELVRWLDARVTEITKAQNVYEHISQLVVAYGKLGTHGVRGDETAFGNPAIVRPFKTVDFMTGEGYYLPESVVREISTEIVKDPRVLRVFYDYTPKPPARTELE